LRLSWGDFIGTRKLALLFQQRERLIVAASGQKMGELGIDRGRELLLQLSYLFRNRLQSREVSFGIAPADCIGD